MLTQLFQPEPNHLKGLSFAKELIRLGHSVEVLTGFPNYPGGRVYKGYRQSWRMRERLDIVPVIRVPLFTDHSSSALRRIFCYISFAFSAVIPGIFLIKKPNVVHVYQGAATLVLPAMVLKLFFGVPFILDVQDLWPESVVGSGMLRFKFLTAILHLWCDFTYRLAAKIVVLSPGYKQAIIRRGVSADKIEVVYNWCDDVSEANVQRDGNVDPFGFEGHFNVVYAGNLGSVQALDSVILAAKSLMNIIPDFRMVFVGDGIDGDRLKKFVNIQKITNVIFIPRQTPDQIGEILEKSEVLLVHLRDDPLTRVGIPQKTQAYLAAGKPIIMAMRGDAASLLKSACAGVVCEQENPQSIADAILSLYQMNAIDRKTMGRNGREYYLKYLSFSVGTQKMEAIFRNVVNGQ